MKDKKELQEKYMEYQMLVQQFQQLQQNISTLQKHVNDLNELKENLSNLTKININDETLMPVGSGIFLRGQLKDNRKAIMNVGANVCVEKNMEDISSTIDKQTEEVSGLLFHMQTQAEAAAERLTELQKELKELKEDSE